MTLARAKPANWGVLEKLTSAQINVIDSQLPYALDGNAGGTYAPSDPIIIGGDGLQITTSLSATGAGSVNFYSGAFVADAASITFSGVPVLFDAISTTTFDGVVLANETVTLAADVGIGTTSGDTLSVAAVSNFAAKATFNGDTEFNGQNQLDDITVFSGTSDTTFAGAVLFDPASSIIFGSGSTITGTTEANLVLGGVSALSFGATSTLGFAAGSAIDLGGILTPSGTGHVRGRTFVVTDAASNTFGINDGDVIVIPATASDRSWTLTSTGAFTGDRIFLSAVASTAFDVTILNDGASPIITLGNGSGDIFWAYLEFRSGAWSVLGYGFQA